MGKEILGEDSQHSVDGLRAIDAIDSCVMNC